MTTTLTATPEPSNVPPRVRLDLTWTGATEASIVRTDPDGQVRTVRDADPVTLTSSTALVYDYESFLGQATSYEAFVSGSSVSSSSVSLDVTNPWLRHPGVPDLSIEITGDIEIAGDGEPVYALNRAKFEPLGREFPLIVTDGRRKAKSTTFRMRTFEEADREALLALLADGSAILLDVPPSLGWARLKHQYMAFADVSPVPIVPSNPRSQWDEWSLPYDQVDRPAGGLQAQRTYATLLSEGSTYLEVDALYDTYADMLAGTTP